MKTETKIQKSYADHGFGFPVCLINVPMVKVRGKWTPNIDYNEFAKVLLKALCFKEGHLTGHEIRFIRLHFEMSLQAVAERFYVTHPAVLKWEKKANEPTSMDWSKEKDIRLFVMTQLSSKATELAKLYEFLEAETKKKNVTLKIDTQQLAA